jgi:hypothetical protein
MLFYIFHGSEAQKRLIFYWSKGANADFGIISPVNGMQVAPGDSYAVWIKTQN